MTQEEKEVLLKDLCARLPYGLICDCGFTAQLKSVCPDGDYCIIQNSPYAIETVKPYLRPLSSMTEEEKETYQMFFNEDGLLNTSVDTYIDWLLEGHFDFRSLIKMGLALEAPKGMYNK